jgi:esterase
MKLHFIQIGEGTPLIILHGLFGSYTNWMTLGKRFSNHFSVYLVDLRNHGQSPHSAEFNYPAMAADIRELITDQQLVTPALLGHSLGGKVAMELACTEPGLVNRLVVVDIAPVTYHHSFRDIIYALDSIPIATLSSRAEADAQLAKTISNPMLRGFLLKNLTTKPTGGYRWKMNLPSIQKNMNQILYGLDEQARYDGSTLFLFGMESDYVKSEYFEKIMHHFPNAIWKGVEHGGYWLHTDQPNAVYETVMDFLTH